MRDGPVTSDTKASKNGVRGRTTTRARRSRSAGTSAGSEIRPSVTIATGPPRAAAAARAGASRVAPRGSDVSLALTPLELARRVCSEGARTVIYTDAARDGSLAGPDVDGARAIAALEGGLEVIVSGGVASLDDLRRVRAAGLAGAIVGRALHEGRFTVREALACVAG